MKSDTVAAISFILISPPQIISVILTFSA